MTVNEIGRLFKSSGDDNQLLDRILAVKRITESLDTTTKDNLTAVLGALRRLIGFDAATVWLVHNKNKKLYPAANLLNQVELPNESITDPTNPESWESLPESPASLSTVSGRVFGSADGRAYVLTAPMKIQERLNGLLNLAFVTDEPPPEDAIRLVGVLGGQLSWAVERCQYRSKLTALYETLSKLETTQRLSPGISRQTQSIAEAYDVLVSISHEVNNSLSVIIGNVQCLIMEKVATSDQSRDRLQRIESAAVKINAINKRLLQVPSLTKHGDKNQDEITIKL
jgi:K+-sensing histidine kinase KdpD